MVSFSQINPHLVLYLTICVSRTVCLNQNKVQCVCVCVCVNMWGAPGRARLRMLYCVITWPSKDLTLGNINIHDLAVIIASTYSCSTQNTAVGYGPTLKSPCAQCNGVIVQDKFTFQTASNFFGCRINVGLFVGFLYKATEQHRQPQNELSITQRQRGTKT